MMKMSISSSVHPHLSAMTPAWLPLLILGVAGLTTATTTTQLQMDISEMGWAFTENIDLDEDTNTVAIQVPHHNEVAATNFVHDFNKNLTLRFLPETWACYLTDLKELRDKGYLAPPLNMKQLLEAAQRKKVRGSRHEASVANRGVDTVLNNWVEGEALTVEEVERLSPSMRAVCPHSHIHPLIPLQDWAHVRTGNHRASDGVSTLIRHRRQDIFTTNCPRRHMQYRCKRKIASCAYIYYQNCPSNRYRETTRRYARCVDDNTLHIIDQVMCCKDCCGVEELADEFNPFCDNTPDFDCPYE